MKLSKQVCTLQQAKRLKELGVKQESIFYFDMKGNLHCITETIGETSYPHTIKSIEVAAFTVAELGEILAKVRYESFGFPLMFTSYSYNYDEMHNIFGKWSCNYRNPRNFENPEIKAETEAESRAQMLIFLLESGTIKSEEING